MSVVALHTPGHFGNHLSFSIGDVALSGDLVLGWASTLVSPPDGEVAAFLASCVRLRALGARALLPGHGDVVMEPASRIDWLVAHRHEREAQIVKALRMGPATAAGLVERLYVDTPRHLWPAAERNVLAHLIDLAGRGLAACAGPLAPGSAFRLVPGGPGWSRRGAEPPSEQGSSRGRRPCDPPARGPGPSAPLASMRDGLLYAPPVFRRSSAVEQLTVNQLVVGSIPTAGAILSRTP